MGGGNESFHMVTKPITCSSVRRQNTIRSATQQKTSPSWHSRVWCSSVCKAGKLDARAKVGRFVGYDSESKGFRIYWPGKRTVTVERDMAVTSKCAIDAERFKSDIRKFWEITDHGPIKWFLGFKIKRDRDARMLAINQHAYIENMVEKF
jgi:hypothetical protein